MKFHIETERLILREVQEQDVDGMFELDSNPTVHQYLGKKPIKTKQQAVEIVKFIKQQYKERGIGRFATIEKSSGDFIGWSGLKLNVGKKEALNGKQNFYDNGYRFLPRYWNKGYATEASIAVLNYGFKTLKLKKIVGAAEIDNIASNKILEKIGLEFICEFDFEDAKVNWYELSLLSYKKSKMKRRAYLIIDRKKEYKTNRYDEDPVFRKKVLENARKKYKENKEHRIKKIKNASDRYYKNKKR